MHWKVPTQNVFEPEDGELPCLQRTLFQPDFLAALLTFVACLLGLQT